MGSEVAQDNNNDVALGDSKANTVVGSQVIGEHAREPTAYLRLDTGEVVIVPAKDVTELDNEFDKWARLIYERNLANSVLAMCDERLEEIARKRAKAPNVRNAELDEQEEAARKIAEETAKWQDEAAENLRNELKDLSKVGDGGKKLIELVPLIRGKQKNPYKSESKNEDWERDWFDLTKAWKSTKGVGLRNRFKAKDRYWGPGTVRHMNNAVLIRKAWPKFKDEKSMKWAEVYKPDQNGQRKIDRKKLRNYLGQQVQSASVKSKDFFKIEIEKEGVLGPEVLENWNADHQIAKQKELALAGVKIGDLDFGAEAALMRYFCGAGLSGELAPLKGNINIKAEANAEVAFGSAAAKVTFYFPSREGLMLLFYDLEQISAIQKGLKPNPHDIGALRLQVSAGISGMVGASLAGELSIGIEMKDVEVKGADGKPRRAKQPQITGRGKKTKRVRRADINGKGAEWKQTAGVDTQISVFAGARGGADLNGSLQWRNPHSKEKKFEVMAAVAPKIEGMAGLAGEAKLAVEYVEGVFRLSVHAGLCLGLGASGEVSLEVGLKQFGSFASWMFYTLGYAEFKTLKFITTDTFEAWKAIKYLMVCEGNEIEAYFGRVIAKIQESQDDWNAKLIKADASIALGKKILANPEKIRLSPPETKGMLIYQLTRFGLANWLEDGQGVRLKNEYLPTQRTAVLKVLHQAQCRADLENIIQHIGPNGDDGDITSNVELLKSFFAAEGPHGLNFPFSRTVYQEEFQRLMRHLVDKDFVAMNGDFGAWYEEKQVALMDTMIRGYPALDNSTQAYALLKDMGRDHPLFSSGDQGFYRDMA